jgi:hypothetical protein
MARSRASSSHSAPMPAPSRPACGWPPQRTAGSRAG